ncbi:MAG: threonine--tRNA ligase [Candidatus Omnitrophica bacterium CG_4_8_14_3_um_filter_43_15]|nr:MAG: threonine--tRNA ligase [Candidatus Omnitrophica bacterium CG_4_8_14_3_um_filter_43_15]PIY84452.1 MAG: threonine--tRNA ligase [Candidatus Omnitrophica bacterium CG_4_10_14_0_8_um_filter_43_18]PJC46411.1 MAG: threonine--tRNA ligase [Candidatus Omnitrophica bacterium CG_4_9_14_0_2_um_filter_43_12]
MNLETLRHSVSHIMAQAVKELWPDAKLAIGPSIDDGFYYDFDKKEPFAPEDLEKIEKKMKHIIKQNLKFERQELDKKEAIKLFKGLKETYKVELIEEIADEKVSVYKHGDFVDLCRGPHVESTGKVKAFKLLSIAGAYWRGSEKNAMLQRIYGTAFLTKEELDKFLFVQEEAKKRDHRKIGKDLDLFSIQDEMGAGLVFWHPKGAFIRNLIENYWKAEHIKRGYELVNIPHIGKIDLWKTSGHVDFYKDYMYSPMSVDEQKYIIKPMNCPGHILIYKSQLHSYRDLPVKFAELGTVYRYERSGVLHGLMRVRGFTQDDAHIFCTQDQVKIEIEKVLDLTFEMLGKFGFKEYDIYISTMPEKHVGADAAWKLATNALTDALKDKVGDKYCVDPGEGVFYGPKIDIKIKDALGRSWQCTTIQVDFNLPERFDVTYIDDSGQKKQPIMIHRAILGSLERFFGVLVEHYAGAFPLWLSPVQAVVIPIKDTIKDYAAGVKEAVQEKGIRVEIDPRSETLNYKIRDAQTNKIPYMVIVGEKEKEKGLISVRSRSEGDLGQMELGKFIEQINKQMQEVDYSKED